ncbi:MAG: LysM peptidoglycan-binding domain-containing protein [Verrucomicrobiota bacterium]
MFVFHRNFRVPPILTRPISGLIFLVLGILMLAGCEEAFQDGATRAKEKAEKKYNEGDFPGAIGFYEEALDGTEKGAEIHYRMALIYDDKLKQPVSAIHHFQRYLDLNPKGSHTKDARNFIKDDQMKLVASLTNGALLTQEDAARLKNDNLTLRKQLTELRAMPRFSPQKGGVPGDATQKPIPPGARTYVVQPGDTLALISRKFYKNSERWKDIEDANFNSLGGKVKLKPGMTLIIP